MAFKSLASAVRNHYHSSCSLDASRIVAGGNGEAGLDLQKKTVMCKHGLQW